jgi:hypothetical protein
LPPANPLEIEKAVDPPQQMIGRDMILKAEVVEKQL